MNLLCDVSNFSKNNIVFLEMKKNIVIDGYFTKMIYSDSYLSLNGLYLYCPIEEYVETNLQTNLMESVDEVDVVDLSQNSGVGLTNEYWIERNKKNVAFSLANIKNVQLMKELSRIEHEIIEYYKDFYKINKLNVYSLRNQMKTGNIKVLCKPSSQIHSIGDDTKNTPNTSNTFVLKISGIWETDSNIGITYKFQK